MTSLNLPLPFSSSTLTDQMRALGATPTIPWLLSSAAAMPAT
jgi:hypothetical protein